MGAYPWVWEGCSGVARRCFSVFHWWVVAQGIAGGARVPGFPGLQMCVGPRGRWLFG